MPLTGRFLKLCISVPTAEYKTEYSQNKPGVAQRIERWTVNQRVAGLIPSQSTCLGCGPGPQYRAYERQPHIDVSLPLILLLFPLSK